MKTVLITGASTGIGEACALWLESRGFRVFAGVRKEADGEALQAKSSKSGGNLVPLIVDVTDSDSVAQAAGVIQSQTGKLHGLVNNAGVAVAGPLEFLPLEELRRQLEVNVIGQIAVTQAFLPLLRQAPGRIVMMSSISGKVAAPLMGPYSSSKFALEALSDSLRRELRDWGIEVSIIEPGNIQTPIWSKGVSWGEQMIANLPQEAKKLYGPALVGIIGYIRRTDSNGLPASEVAKVVEHALTAPRPRTRYVVGRGAKIAALLARVLPDRLMDQLIANRRRG